MVYSKNGFNYFYLIVVAPHPHTMSNPIHLNTVHDFNRGVLGYVRWIQSLSVAFSGSM
jgi:hypothetical protein